MKGGVGWASGPLKVFSARGKAVAPRLIDDGDPTADSWNLDRQMQCGSQLRHIRVVHPPSVSLGPDALAETFRRLDHEYAIRTPACNPPKTSVPLQTDARGLPTRYINHMLAILSDGTFGAKLVFVDETTGRLRGRVVVYDSDGNLLVNQDAEPLTAVRCGLMAALAIHRCRRAEPQDYRQLTIGFIGTGRINRATAAVLHELWGCDQFILRGNAPNIAKNASLFPGRPEIATALPDLARCDVLISCTNNADPARLIETDALAGPRLFIAQDGGFLLGSSFRTLWPSYTDDVEQLSRHLPNEFPFDAAPVTLAGDLNHPALGIPSPLSRTGAACVYLYGIALADVVTAVGLADGRGQQYAGR
ncbi:MAG: hypothetical protein HQL82_15120 [Magnetococcales bacterium]|nr:hypothetical protein [Magnetococcales bacterium]